MLHLRTFCGLSLSGAQLPATAAQPRRLALLVLLARSREGVRTRDSLMALLWPESSTEKARHALDQLLYATRRDLGRDVILSEAGRLRLNPLRFRADCADLAAALEAGERATAVQLYTGPFLEGTHFDDAPELERWVEQERDAIARQVAAALEELADEAEARGEVAAAVRWRRRRTELDPFCARTAMRLMRALQEADDPAAALQHARAYASRIRDELGIDPDADVTAFAERIGQAQPRPDPILTGLLAMDASPEPVAPLGASTADAVPPEPSPPAVAGPPPSGPAQDAAGADQGPTRPTRNRRRMEPVLLGAMVIAAAVAFTLWPSLRADVAGSAPVTEAAGAADVFDPVAHELYLRGRIEWNRRSREGLERSVVLFRQAIEQQPRSAEAHAGLAEAYVMLGYHGFLPADASFPKGRAAALAALALDSTRGDAYAALGVALQAERRWDEADQAFRRAIHHSPDYATAHQWYALLLTILGRGDEAVTHGRRAAELDPLSIQVNNTYGIMLYNAGMLDAAMAVYARIVTHEPDTAWVRANPWVLANFGKVASKARHHEQGLAMLYRALEIAPGHPRLHSDLTGVYLDMGDIVQARAIAAAADPAHPQYRIYDALMRAALGDVDGAFAAFDQVQDWGLPSLISVSGPGSIDALRADPRYPALRRRIGLPAESRPLDSSPSR